MQIFGAVWRTELRLAWRRPSFWVAQALVLLPVVLLLLSSGPTGLELSIIVSGMLLILELFVLSIIVGPAVTRDLGAAGELLWTRPLDAVVHMLGMAFGLWIAQMPLLILQVAARWLVATLKGWPGTVLFWTYGLPMLALGITVGLLLVICLGLVVRRTLPLIIVSSVVWFAFFQLTSPSALSGITFLSMFSIATQQVRPSAALGVEMYLPLLGTFALTSAGVGAAFLLFAVVLACAIDQRRQLRSQWLPPTIAVVALVAIGTGSFGFAGAAARAETPLSPQDIQQQEWAVQTHSLRAVVAPKEGRVTGDSTLELRLIRPTENTKEESVVLRLNPGMTISSASDESGRVLETRREGDSVIVSLTGPAQDNLKLTLHWQGTVDVPYASYSVRFGYAPPVGSLLTGNASYLLRDGDWHPWPWSTGPHQALDPQRSEVTLEVAGLSSEGEILTPDPAVQRGATFSWRGLLPPVLLVLPPPAVYEAEGITVHAGPLSSQRAIEELRAYVAAARRTWESLGSKQPPRHLVALPYLPQEVWSGNLLLFREIAYPAPADLQERLALEAVASTWFRAYAPPVQTSFVRVPAIQGSTKLGPGSIQGSIQGSAQEGGTGNIEQGRWVEAPDAQSGTSDPHYAVVVLSTWVALELHSSGVQPSDLEELKNVPHLRSYAPGVLALHSLVEKIGADSALERVGVAVQEEGLGSLEQLLATLTQDTGEPLIDEWKLLQSQFSGT